MACMMTNWYRTTPTATVKMNHINCAITKWRSLTLKILPAITELMPTGVSHMTQVTIFMTTSKTAAKKSTTTCPFWPIVPRNVPKTKQKNTMPKVLVPLRYWMTRISCGSSVSRSASVISSLPSPPPPLLALEPMRAVLLTVSLNVLVIEGLGR